MSGQRKKGKGKGKGKDKEDDGAGAFSVDFGQEKGKDIYIPGSFWGLAGDDANKMWKCSSAPNEEFQKLIKKHRAASRQAHRSTKLARNIKQAQRNLGIEGGKEPMPTRRSAMHTHSCTILCSGMPPYIFGPWSGFWSSSVRNQQSFEPDRTGPTPQAARTEPNWTMLLELRTGPNRTNLHG